MAKFYEKFYNAFLKLNFLFLITSGKGVDQFITSDNPVILFGFEKLNGKFYNFKTIYFPFSPSIALLLNDKCLGIKNINKQKTELFNSTTIKQSDQYLISNSRKLLLNIKLITKSYDQEKIKKMISEIL
ncbi:DUF4238 domain-containing protein [Patescibacteria group bacterium]|nr:DUF4238 domain-containing protein [Patescibacteria group bacterium]